MPALKDRMRSAAIVNAGLAALIGQNWFDVQIPQTASFPAVVVQQISAPRLYHYGPRPKQYYVRCQFTIWGGQFSAGAEARDSIAEALFDFLDVTPFDGIAGRPAQPNYIVGDRDGLFPQTDGPIYQRLLDAMIFTNETL